MVRPAMASVLLLLLISLLYSGLCDSMDDEGIALLRFRECVEADPRGALADWGSGSHCSWFGVACSDDGRVVALHLKDLCLKGTLTPELGKLIHMKSLILSNNSFYGTVPGAIKHLQNLQVMDFGHNNLSGPLPSGLYSNSSLEALVLKNNSLIHDISQEFQKINVHSGLQVDQELMLSNRRYILRKTRKAINRRLLQVTSREKNDHQRSEHHGTNLASSPSWSFLHPWRPKIPVRETLPISPSNPPVISPSPAEPPVISPSPSNDVMTHRPPSSSLNSPAPSPYHAGDHGSRDRKPSLRNQTRSEGPSETEASKQTSWAMYISVAGGVSFLIAISAIYISCCRKAKVVTIMPWSTGLSGQLQKALVTGVPSLKRSELDRACEDFSNVIGSLSECTLYKGTLSSGVEIAVTSTMITSAKEWPIESETQFRKKISVLSKVNHKNLMNLLGYCEEEQPFTRMMVFEYAPNGTLFEHLHIREAEHLDWAMRLRIIMGIAYCLEHMHQLNPPVVLRNLHSSSIYLTEDYAAKISDLGYWNDESESANMDESPGLLDAPVSAPESVVYKFGIVLLEMISGRRPFSEDDGLLVLWASCYLNGERPLRGMVDSTLESFSEDDVSALCDVIRSCINPNPSDRPSMTVVAGLLRKITAMPPDGATPKLSPLWWAELEIISLEAS